MMNIQFLRKWFGIIDPVDDTRVKRVLEMRSLTQLCQEVIGSRTELN